MKTVFIAASPKKRWSNSAYLLAITRGLTRGEKVWVNFRGVRDYPQIIDALQDADALVFGMPLYVDAVPSHVLELLQELERRSAETPLHCRVYGLCNCGFYEGEQCELELALLECWCERCRLTFSGGVGIGAGEMLGVLRLSPVIGLAAMLVEFIIRLLFSLCGGLSAAAVLHCLNPLSAVISLLVWPLFSLGPWISAAKLGKSVSTQRRHLIAFSTVSCCPAFLFAFFGDLYWIIRAFACHFVPVWRLFLRRPPAEHGIGQENR